MITKEQGYDEFLAKSIALGEADSQAGRVHSGEEVRKEIFDKYILPRTADDKIGTGFIFNSDMTFEEFKQEMLD
ncbi:hypothetical protein [Lonepinella sp. BR2271]|uniref:hypothetical protein n=1 Tax=Lonepinella sp. BR2271 TaxID=3434550 RepID=UPI003F6E16B9